MDVENNVSKISKMKQLVRQILTTDNQYYITNIIVEIVTITFEYVKARDYDEIKIMSSYDKCIEVLQTMCDNKAKHDNGNTLLAQYKEVLHHSEEPNTIEQG